MSEATCQVCSKGQAELIQPLKRCAKCQTGSYCSRDCQKADWKEHKKTCTAQTSNADNSTIASTVNYLDATGEFIDATYSMGCYDQHGNPLSDGLPVGQRRNRTFDPAVKSNYTKPWLAPYELLRYVSNVELTFLCRSTVDGEYQLEQDTIVLEVGAREKNGFAIGARSFGKDSNYNRCGMPELQTTHNVISRSTCVGCQDIGNISGRNPGRIKRAIIMTSSKVICDGVNRIFDWFKDGFPIFQAGGMAKDDWIMLHANIKALEDTGIAVNFWETEREYIVNATRLAVNKFLDLGNVPVDNDRNNCTCSDCVIKKQLNELKYAKTGVTCCPCAHSLSLIAKNLKRGDNFVITNNAGVTEPTVTMEVDGGSTFRNPSAFDT